MTLEFDFLQAFHSDMSPVAPFCPSGMNSLSSC